MQPEKLWCRNKVIRCHVQRKKSISPQPFPVMWCLFIQLGRAHQGITWSRQVKHSPISKHTPHSHSIWFVMENQKGNAVRVTPGTSCAAGFKMRCLLFHFPGPKVDGNGGASREWSPWDTPLSNAPHCYQDDTVGCCPQQQRSLRGDTSWPSPWRQQGEVSAGKENAVHKILTVEHLSHVTGE